MNYLGPKCLEAGQPSELHLRNAAQLCTQNEPLDSLRIYIGLSGIQYAGVSIIYLSYLINLIDYTIEIDEYPRSHTERSQSTFLSDARIGSSFRKTVNRIT